MHREAEGSLRFREEGKEATHFSRQVTTQPRDCDNQADTGSCSSGSSSSRSNGRWRKASSDEEKEAGDKKENDAKSPALLSLSVCLAVYLLLFSFGEPVDTRRRRKRRTHIYT